MFIAFEGGPRDRAIEDHPISAALEVGGRIRFYSTHPDDGRPDEWYQLTDRTCEWYQPTGRTGDTEVEVRFAGNLPVFRYVGDVELPPESALDE